MFWLKKIAGQLLMPYTFALLLLLAGLARLWLSRRPGAGRALVTAGTALLLVAGCDPIAQRLMGSLESEYGPLLEVDGLHDVRWVVVLGGGHTHDPGVPAVGQLSGPALARLAEGIRLHRQLPESRLLLSGAGIPVSHARVLADAAAALGVPSESMVLEERPRDTETEALLIGRRLGAERFVLVTSSSHMPRAVALFQAAGGEPVPAATDFRSPDARKQFPESYLPGSGALRSTERALHEFLGRVWSAVRGLG